jgi:F-type H+-transporting ATPase subunit c
MESESVKYIAAGLTMCLGGIAPALAIGLICSRAIESMARNPKVADKITTTMLIASAITESIGIYSLVISLIILFVV